MQCARLIKSAWFNKAEGRGKRFFGHSETGVYRVVRGIRLTTNNCRAD